MLDTARDTKSVKPLRDKRNKMVIAFFSLNLNKLKKLIRHGLELLCIELLGIELLYFYGLVNNVSRQDVIGWLY